MKTLENKTNNTANRIFQSLLIVIFCLITSDVLAQNKEVIFDVYTNSAAKASQYLLGDDVALRDCPSAQCEQLTTLNIGTNVRLLAKSSAPQTIGGVTSRWYKIKMGPQVGWIWGGLISQNTLVSRSNPEVKFLLGEAGYDYKGNKHYQVRAVKNGVEVDKLIFEGDGTKLSGATMMSPKSKKMNNDVIDLSTVQDGVVTKPFYIVFKDGNLKKTESLVAFSLVESSTTPIPYVVCVEDNE